MDRTALEKYVADFQYPFCNDVAKYQKSLQIGQGTFGEVWKARHKTSNQIVALKKVLMDNEKEGFPITSLREIKILQRMRHENIVSLLEVCRNRSNNGNGSTIHLVFEFCDHDLAGLLANPNVKFSLGQIKSVVKQLLDALYYIHTNKVLHRDIKTSNVLITKAGILKSADFGLARPFSFNDSVPNRYTSTVVTLWYRPPEILLGERNYGPAVDMWGAGCIMAEMWTRIPILQGVTEQHQLGLIAYLCGSITPEVWPGVQRLELYNKLDLPQGQKRKVVDRLKFSMKDPHGCDLLDNLLKLDPSERMDADTALDHEFFWSDPMPSDLGMMLQEHRQSMFNYLIPPKNGSSSKTVSRPAHAQTRVKVNNTLDSGFYDRVF